MEEVNLRQIEIEDVLKILDGQPSPHELASLKVVLAGNYFFLSGRMDLCDKKERDFNIEFDSLGYTEKASEALRKRTWKMTEWGLEQTFLKNRMKAIDRLTSAISTKLRTSENEMRLSGAV